MKLKIQFHAKITAIFSQCVRQLFLFLPVPYTPWNIPQFLYVNIILGLYLLSGRTSYRKISWSFEAAGFRFRFIQSLWNLTGTSAAALSKRLSNVQVVRLLKHPISPLRDITRVGGKTSYRLVNRGPELLHWHWRNRVIAPVSVQQFGRL